MYLNTDSECIILFIGYIDLLKTFVVLNSVELNLQGFKYGNYVNEIHNLSI